MTEVTARSSRRPVSWVSVAWNDAAEGEGAGPSVLVRSGCTEFSEREAMGTAGLVASLGATEFAAHSAGEVMLLERDFFVGVEAARREGGDFVIRRGEVEDLSTFFRDSVAGVVAMGSGCIEEEVRNMTSK